MLINLTNHPAALWDNVQLTAAMRQFSSVIDLPFPSIDPSGDETYIAALADQFLDKVLSLANGQQATVHLMGEMTFTVALLKRLQKHNIPCVASTTQRIVQELSNGERKTRFQFLRFRNYE